MKKLAIVVTAAAVVLGVSACDPAPPPPAPTSVAKVAGKAVAASRAVVTPDGRYVAYASADPRIVAGFAPQPGSGLLSARLHVYRLDRKTAVTVPVSVSAGGGPMEVGIGQSELTISDDGRYVAFTTASPGLVPGDTDSFTDVFVRDVVAGTTERVSQRSDGGGPDRGSSYAAISPNGAWVAYATAASNLGPADADGNTDVYRWQRSTHQIVKVSVGDGGVESDRTSLRGVPLDDGRVAFASSATNLLPGAPLAGNNQYVYLRDPGAGTTQVISRSSTGGAIPGEIRSITGTGRYLLFASTSKGVPADVDNRFELYVRDLVAGTTKLAITTRTGAIFEVAQGRLSANGRYLVVVSRNADIVTGDPDAGDDVFVKDRTTGKVHQVDRLPDGSVLGSAANTTGFDVTNDGRTVVFATSSHAYGPDDGTSAERTFVERTPFP